MNITTIVGASNEGNLKDSWYHYTLQLTPSIVYTEMHKILKWLHKDLPNRTTKGDNDPRSGSEIFHLGTQTQSINFRERVTFQDLKMGRKT
jgi:hypothetical protein